MLLRFLIMKSAINWWIQRKNIVYETLKLNDAEWNQMKYLLQFLKFIKNVTNYLSQIKTMTIHKTWSIYDELFNHLKNQKKQTRKIHRALWTINLQIVIEAERAKLTLYNDKTKQSFDRFLNFAIILNSETKLKFYKIIKFITKFYHAKSCFKNEKTKICILCLIEKTFWITTQNIICNTSQRLNLNCSDLQIQS